MTPHETDTDRGPTNELPDTAFTGRRYVLGALGASGVIGIAGCLSDDGDGNGETSSNNDDVSDADDDGDPGTNGDDDSEDGDGEESAENGDDGIAEITLLGETYTSSGLRVGCYDEGATLASTFETEFHVGADLWVTFQDDSVEIRSTVYTESQTADDYDGEEDREVYTAEVNPDELEFDIDEEENSSSASGSVHLEAENGPAEDANPNGIEVEFEIAC
jgi:hypothetical protein